MYTYVTIWHDRCLGDERLFHVREKTYQRKQDMYLEKKLHGNKPGILKTISREFACLI